MDDRITHVLVSLVDIPATGMAKTLVRLRTADRDNVTLAAQIVGMTQQDFMKTVLVSAAERVLKEAGAII